MDFKNIAIAIMAISAITLTACVDDDNSANDNVTVAFINTWPTDVASSNVSDAQIVMTERNSGRTYTINPLSADLSTLPIGVYDYDATATATVSQSTDETTKKRLRASGNSLTLTTSTQISLQWFYESSAESLLFSEIYATGSPNATATGGIRDTYLRIYNNSDQTVYADGIGIAESAFVNARSNTFEILTPANDRQVNFTAATIWVIPGNGTEHPIAPGQSLTIVDQAIDWSAQVAGALNHTDADFEWYDDNAQDTDNPSVANLDKWYCYSNTIWVISNQCNRSYALVKFPEGTTAEQYLAEYAGGYDYIHTIGTQMHNDKAYLIPNEWILDGVNLGTGESYVYGALGTSVDMSYGKISDYDRDPNRFGYVFRRKTAITRADGTVILQDTNDSTSDFSLVKANQ